MNVGKKILFLLLVVFFSLLLIAVMPAGGNVKEFTMQVLNSILTPVAKTIASTSSETSQDTRYNASVTIVTEKNNYAVGEEVLLK